MAKEHDVSNEDLSTKAINNWFWGLVITGALFCFSVILFIL